ncbi:MAG: L-2-amino-thiazoline-4-carboxylic acid hydrolase [Alphaproteobacteria bacterium]|nr:L-2-amino-thiazoline-4-carboxylic acid hydrolase [Alphaproteobacteria bacterium]
MDPADTARKRLAELDDSHKHRALLYWSIYQELAAELGEARAEAILMRAIERRGVATGRALFGAMAAATPADVAAKFLSVSPGDGTLWPHQVVRHGDGSVEIAVRRCPLKEAWTEAGLTAEEMTRMCRIAGRFDNGCFGEAPVGFEATTWAPGHAGCCTLTLRPR